MSISNAFKLALQKAANIFYDGSTSGLAATDLQEAVDESAAPRGYIFGLTLSNNTTDAANDIDIAPGQAASDAATSARMTLASAITKRLDAAWSVGTGNGGLDTGSITDTTYHIWIIRRSDTGVVDALFSTSATAPTMPANYDQKRRIGSILRVGGIITPFFQFGNIFLKKTPTLDATSPSATTATLVALGLPLGIRVVPIVNVNNATGDVRTYISSPEVDDLAVGGFSTAPAYDLRVADASSAPVEFFNTNHLITNTAGQIRHRSNATGGSIAFVVRGWIDTRGRDV